MGNVRPRCAEGLTGPRLGLEHPGLVVVLVAFTARAVVLFSAVVLREAMSRCASGSWVSAPC